jgi:hypothetical protein
MISWPAHQRLEMASTSGFSRSAASSTPTWTGVTKGENFFALNSAEEPANQTRSSYQPAGNTPIGYLKAGIRQEDILLGDGFLERGSACLLAGPSGIGKSSIALQSGCCWSCGVEAFNLSPPRPLRIVMIQNEDSHNDLVRMSEMLHHLNLDRLLIEKNFWIETLRGKIGPSAVRIMTDLTQWWKADLLLINPISAYHDGDISQNKDNIKFLYGDLGELLQANQIGVFGFHHKGKPLKDGRKSQRNAQHETMYDILGGSVLTNFFRGIITVSPIANSKVFKFTLAKRFEESRWILPIQEFKWHEDRSKRLWIPATVAEAIEATQTRGKTIEDLYKLLPLIGSIHRDQLYLKAKKEGFTRDEYRGLLAEATRDDTPDSTRIYVWQIYTGKGRAAVNYARNPQPDDQKPDAVKAARRSKTS